MMGGTDWLSATAMLVSGLVLGAMFVYAVYKPGRRKSGSAPDLDVEQRDLEAKRDALLQQLRELDDAAGKTASSEVVAERNRLEIEAARVLQSLDQQTQVRAGAGRKAAVGAAASGKQEAEEKPTGFLAEHPALRGFLWGALSIGALAFLGYFVMQSSKQRTGADGATGGVPMQTGSGVPTQQQVPPVDPAVRAIEAQVQSNPNDLELRDQLAKAYLDTENLRGVVEQTQFVLQRKPNDPRALTYEALVRMTMGQNEQAGAMLDAATKTDPNLMEAWIGLAWLRTLTGKDAEAQAAIDEAARRRPDEKARLDELLAQMRQHQTTTASAVQQQQGQPSAAVGAPMGNPGAAGDASASAGDPKQSVQITLDIDPAAKGRIPPNGVIFLLARPEGVTSGPPLAVKRVMPGAFPMSVAIGAADSMMGQPLPAKVRIEARYDADGNAMTRSPEDLNAVADGVAVGSAAITMKLR